MSHFHLSTKYLDHDYGVVLFFPYHWANLKCFHNAFSLELNFHNYRLQMILRRKTNGCGLFHRKAELDSLLADVNNVVLSHKKPLMSSMSQDSGSDIRPIQRPQPKKPPPGPGAIPPPPQPSTDDFASGLSTHQHTQFKLSNLGFALHWFLGVWGLSLVCWLFQGPLVCQCRWLLRKSHRHLPHHGRTVHTHAAPHWTSTDLVNQSVWAHRLLFRLEYHLHLWVDNFTLPSVEARELTPVSRVTGHCVCRLLSVPRRWRRRYSWSW